MKHFQVDLNEILEITMLGRDFMTKNRIHCTRVTEDYIVYIINSGVLNLWVDDEEVILKEGDVYFFGKGCFQRPSVSSECDFYYIHFNSSKITEIEMSDGDFFETAITKEDLKPLVKQKLHIASIEFFEELVNTLQKNLMFYANATSYWKFYVSNVIANVFIKLENYAVEEIKGSIIGKNLKAHNVARRIREYVGMHYREAFGSSEICEKFWMSYDYANRIFKERYGCGIIKYRNKLRIEEAKYLISNTERNFYEIAHEVGFINQYYFCRYFKSEVGVTPSEYRNHVKCKAMLRGGESLNEQTIP